MNASPASTPALLRTRDIVVRFGGIEAIGGVSLAFHAGQICGLIGPNGAGKTTLIDCLSGHRLPSSGQVVFDGADVTKRSSTELARMGLRRTFQRQQTFGWLTVEDNVLVALEWHGGRGGVFADIVRTHGRTRQEKQRRERVDEILELCGLSADAKTLAHSLPIGKARRLEVARAIVDTPRVLLLDEPTSGLDEEGTERLSSVIRELRTVHSCAVVMIEHDMRFVMNFCERLVVMNLGKVLADGPLEEVRNLPEVVSAYLGVS